MSNLILQRNNLPSNIEDLSKFALIGREKLTAKKLRKTLKIKKEPCFICGKYEIVCEWHHVIMLKEAAEIFSTCDIDEIYIPVVCLCPTHHALFHKYLLKEKDLSCIALALLKEDGNEKMREIFAMRNKILLELGEFRRVFE